MKNIYFRKSLVGIVGLTLCITLLSNGCKPDNSEAFPEKKSTQFNKINTKPNQSGDASNNIVSAVSFNAQISVAKLNSFSESEYVAFELGFKDIINNDIKTALSVLTRMVDECKDSNINNANLCKLLSLYFNNCEYSKSGLKINSIPLIELTTSNLPPESLIYVIKNSKNDILKGDFIDFFSTNMARKYELKTIIKLISISEIQSKDSVILRSKLYDSYFRIHYDSTEDFLRGDKTFNTNTKLIKNLAITLVETNTSKGANLILELSQSNNNYEPISSFIDIWMDHNSLKATKWADSLQDPKAKDAASAAIVNSLSRSKQFKEAEAWLSNIKDTELRSRTAELLEIRK